MSRKMTPRKYKKRFFFGSDDRAESLLFDTIPTFLGSLVTAPRRLKAERGAWLVHEEPMLRSVRPVATWIGHASFLIQLGGVNILTDPVFGDLSFLFRRVMPPGIALSSLPPIDVVLISHNHPDHMDAPSLKGLLKRNPDIKALVPQGDKEWFQVHGFVDPVEHTWWDKSDVASGENGDSVACTFLPAAHWSQRGLFDQNSSLWGGWMISHGKQNIYFAGDTAYAHHFGAIAHEFPAILAALMPIGPREPYQKMRRTHLCPHEAVTAFRELGAQQFVPMHWGTFTFGTDEFDEPIQALQHYWQEQTGQLKGRRLHLAKAGQRLQLD